MAISSVFIPTVFAQNIPRLVQYVNDFAGVLTPSEIDAINILAGEIERNTTVQIAVLTVKTTQPMAIDEYATEVFRENGIGHRDNNNGLLIVAAIDDRKWRIEVGYGLEGTINDAKAGDIGRAYIVPYFQREEYGSGLYLAVQSIGRIVQGSEDQYIISKDIFANVDLITPFLPFAIIVFVIIVAIFATNVSRCPKCGALTRGTMQGEEIVFVCKNKHRWKRKIRRKFFFFVGGGGWGSGGGGGGFGGGSSGGGGAGGGW